MKLIFIQYTVKPLNKAFLNPIRVHALVEWQGYETQTTNLGVDRLPKILVHFHKKAFNRRSRSVC